MIEVVAKYPVIYDDFDVVQKAAYEVLDSLIDNPDVLEADMGLSMSEKPGELEFSLVFDIDDLFEATPRSIAALRQAFGAAGMELPSEHYVRARESLLGLARSFHTEMMPA